MKRICTSTHFDVVVLDQPHVSRSDGGHVVINPKIAVEDRAQLDGEQAIELAKLTMAVGEAMKTVLTRRGVPIGRINYQDNGNWRAELHVHLYGRATNATLQPYGHSLRFPATKADFVREMGNLEPLDDDDVAALNAEIVRLLATERYRAW
jgi:diadenosine tetraphosphate (Ap4A) HIT family hydrolase